MSIKVVIQFCTICYNKNRLEIGGILVTDKNVELMKQLIEDKKKKSDSQVGDKRAPGSLGNARKGIKQYKRGGLFDK